MNHLQILTVSLSVFFVITTQAQHQTSTFDEPVVGGIIPYQIELREISLAPADIPNIHSMAAAEWDHQWVILAGRTNGLHSMRGNGAFDPAESNFDVWVIGHIFGGLISDAGNDGNTGASGRIFEVLLTPNLPQAAQSIDWNSNLVSLAWDSDDQATYVIEHSPNLIDWNGFLPTILGNGQLLQWTETRTAPQHFYRVLGGVITRDPQ